MNKNVTWRELKALDDIYHLKKTRANIKEHPYINYLINDCCILDLKATDNRIIITTDAFEEFYEKEFKIAYDEAKHFLLENGIEVTARKSFTLEDIKVLMLIAENRAELKSNPTNIEDFSSEFFDSSKYLKNKSSIRNAVFKILDIQEFALDKKENNWRLVIDHPNPRAIIICENKSFMKQPWIVKRAEVKLWHFGGNNIGMVEDIDDKELSRPIFYSCDWDLHGMLIYLRIKERLRKKGGELRLLYPNLPHKKISTYIDFHNSHWDLSKKFSGLPVQFFNPDELKLLSELIQEEKWIEEESFNLLEMLLALVILNSK